MGSICPIRPTRPPRRPCPPETVQTGDQPETAPDGRERLTEAVVPRRDLVSSGQGLPRRREHAGESRNDLSSPVLPGAGWSEKGSGPSTSDRTHQTEAASGRW